MRKALNTEIVESLDEITGAVRTVLDVMNDRLLPNLNNLVEDAKRTKEPTGGMRTRANSVTSIASLEEHEKARAQMPDSTDASSSDTALTAENREKLLISYSETAVQMESLWNSISDYFQNHVVVPHRLPQHNLPLPMDQVLSTEVPLRDEMEYQYRGIELPPDCITAEETAELESLMQSSAADINSVLEDIVDPQLKELEIQIKSNQSRLKKLHKENMAKALMAKTEDEFSRKREREF